MIVHDILTFIWGYLNFETYAQITGFMGMMVILTAFMQKDDHTVVKLLFLANFFWGIHFIMLGVYSGVAAVMLSVARLLLSLKYKKNCKVFWGMVIAALTAGFLTFSGFLSMFPIISSILGTYGFFYLEKIRLRMLMMCSSLLWLSYNISIGSLAGITNEVLVQITLGFTIYRMTHPEWIRAIYAQKITDILLKRSKPDYDRYIFIRDKLAHMRHSLWSTFLHILHYDLRTFFHQRKSRASKIPFHSHDDQSRFHVIPLHLHHKK